MSLQVCFFVIVQSIAAALAFFISLQGLAEVGEGLTGGVLKSACCPLVWLYLARKVNSFYPSCFLLLGGLFIAVVLVPSVTLPAVANADDGLFSVLGLGTFLSLNLWAAYHAHWAQTTWFNGRSAR